MTLVFGVFFGVFYLTIMKYLGLRVKEAKEKAAADQTERDRKILRVDAWLTEKGWKN